MISAPPALQAGHYRRTAAQSTWPGVEHLQPSDVAAAVDLIRRHGPPTPMILSRHLSERYGRQIFLKLEMHSPVRSFKHRGALVEIEHLRADPRVRTVLTASTGNHGQGIAYAAGRAGLASIVLSPEGAAPEKLDAMRQLGADVRIAGTNLGQSQALAEEMADEQAAYVEDGESPHLMTGAGTVVAEILDDPNGAAVDTILCPVGGGNLISGGLLVNALDERPRTIVGVQSTAASGVTRSWLDKAMSESPCDTFAGGLATTRPGHLALDVVVEYLEHMILVDESDLYAAMATSLATAGVYIEGASAASIAALERYSEEIPGDTLALVLTGSWASQRELATAVELMVAENSE